MDTRKTLLIISLFFSFKTFAFCGFFVSKADTNLFNRASKVVVMRDKNRTVLTLANDYQGEVKDFAMVIPVPEVLKEGQIHITENRLIEHLDAYSAPRLVEYYDSDPCMRRMYKLAMMDSVVERGSISKENHAEKLGVKIEAEYTVGEYDILILSAKESSGLVTWLKENKYKIPNGVEPVVESYLKQGMKFFVARVNLKEQGKLGYSYLRPIQVAYESSKFMLPIRLGMANSKGEQELFVFALTREGRIETTNYRTVKIPSEIEIPVYVKEKNKFAEFYRSMFSTAVNRDGKGSVFLEYAWDMSWCDPCAADPLSNKDLRELGAFWVPKDEVRPLSRKTVFPPPKPANVFITRLHLRYNKKTHPEDLFFQMTGDRENFQGRYILRHPWDGKASCEEGKKYLSSLPKRREERAKSLANLTGWSIKEIRSEMNLSPQRPPKKKTWWESLWN